MSGIDSAVIRSFILTLYNHRLDAVAHYRLPIKAAAPLANRIFDTRLSVPADQVREPSFFLRAFVYDGDRSIRSSFPEGPTSLCGGRYDPATEPPPRLRIHPQAGFTHGRMTLYDFNEPIFDGVYTMTDIFLAIAERLARHAIERDGPSPADLPAYFSVEGSTMSIHSLTEDLFPPEAYAAEGVFRLPRLLPGRRKIRFRKIPEAPLPERDPEDLPVIRTIGRGGPHTGRVFMRKPVYDGLAESFPLSREVETGGFLVGRPSRQPGSPESEDDPGFRWLVEITDLVPAEGAHGQSMALLFNSDTWSRLGRRIDRDFADKKLVSWFHTHLFRATEGFGLSGMDLDLHRQFFPRPWQFAVLINIDRHGDREIRCFQYTPENELAECDVDVIDA